MEIVEILFNKFDEELYLALLDKIKNNAKKWNFNSSLDVSQNITQNSLKILKSNGGSICFNFYDIQIFGLKFKYFGLYINMYIGFESDLLFFIDKDEFDKYDILEIKKMAEKSAKFLNAEEFYCGLEPASDENTQFFKKTR